MDLGSNRYTALFENALDKQYREDVHQNTSDFISRLLLRLAEKLKADGQPERAIASELALARAGAEIAERNFLVRRAMDGSAAAFSNMPKQQPLPDRGRLRADKRRSLRTLVLFLASFLTVIAYCATNIMFAFEHRQGPPPATAGEPSTNLTIDIGVADFKEQNITLHLLPISGQFVGKDGRLTDDIEIEVEGGDGVVTHLFRAHSHVPPFTTTVEIDSGDLMNYPFDMYLADLDIRAKVKGQYVPINTVLDDVPHGLEVTIEEDAASRTDVGDTLVISRSAIELFVIFLSVGSLVVVTISSLWVAWFVILSRREIEFDILVWTAALLFVIPTTRDALPGTPPYGAAVDFMVFFWLQAAVAVATIVLVYAWVRRTPENAV